MPTVRRWRLGTAAPDLAGTALVAVLCNLALELTQLTRVIEQPWRHKTPAYVALFLLGCLVLWLLVGLVHAVVGRLWLTTVLMSTATAVVAVADHEKLRLLHEPLYPNDWQFVDDLSFLADVVGYRAVALLVAGTLVMALAVTVGVRTSVRRFADGEQQTARANPRRSRMLLRGLTGGLCLLGIGYLAGFNSPGNAARSTYDALGATWKPWSQERNYLGNGFVGGFLYNLSVPEMTRPGDYNAAEMARIVAKYTAAAERINEHREPQALNDVNVVMVLSESFSDPAELDGVHLDEDPIPFTRALMDGSMSGRMLAQNIGGGTANMEFEALTGMSLSQLPPQLRVPYQQLVPDHATFPSAVEWFRKSGHHTVAIHPYTTEMYRRREVYRAFGFDDFVYDRTMRERRIIGGRGFIADVAAFQEVQQRIATTTRPLFVNLVTMQNHIPFRGRYDNPVRATGPGGEPLQTTGQYARGLAHSDKALRGFIRGLSRSDEKTVVVFYGDHLPATYPDSVFAANSRRTMHQTPFFVWASFPGPEGAQPTTSPIHFVNLILERSGVEVPPYYALLHLLRQEIPAMDSGMIIDGDDRLVRPGTLSDRAVRLLHDYRLVQYDLAFGSRYTEDAMFRAPQP